MFTVKASIFQSDPCKNKASSTVFLAAVSIVYSARMDVMMITAADGTVLCKYISKDFYEQSMGKVSMTGGMADLTNMGAFYLVDCAKNVDVWVANNYNQFMATACNWDPIASGPCDPSAGSRKLNLGG